jgi:hypothetical protein
MERDAEDGVTRDLPEHGELELERGSEARGGRSGERERHHECGQQGASQGSQMRGRWHG